MAKQYSWNSAMRMSSRTVSAIIIRTGADGTYNYRTHCFKLFYSESFFNDLYKISDRYKTTAPTNNNNVPTATELRNRDIRP